MKNKYQDTDARHAYDPRPVEAIDKASGYTGAEEDETTYCAECDGENTVEEVFSGDEGWSVCKECRMIEGDTYTKPELTETQQALLGELPVGKRVYLTFGALREAYEALVRKEMIETKPPSKWGAVVTRLK